MPCTMLRMLVEHLSWRAVLRAWPSAGSKRLMSIPMIAMTTSSSMSVNAERTRRAAGDGGVRFTAISTGPGSYHPEGRFGGTWLYPFGSAEFLAKREEGAAP